MRYGSLRALEPPSLFLLPFLTPFRSSITLSRVSFSRDPLTDVSWTILELDAVRFTPLKKPDCVAIYQSQVFQIQNYFPSTSFGSQKRFHLSDLLCVHSTRQR